MDDTEAKAWREALAGPAEADGLRAELAQARGAAEALGEELAESSRAVAELEEALRRRDAEAEELHDMLERVQVGRGRCGCAERACARERSRRSERDTPHPPGGRGEGCVAQWGGGETEEKPAADRGGGVLLFATVNALTARHPTATRRQAHPKLIWPRHSTLGTVPLLQPPPLAFPLYQPPSLAFPFLQPPPSALPLLQPPSSAFTLLQPPLLVLPLLQPPPLVLPLPAAARPPPFRFCTAWRPSGALSPTSAPHATASTRCAASWSRSNLRASGPRSTARTTLRLQSRGCGRSCPSSTTGSWSCKRWRSGGGGRRRRRRRWRSSSSSCRPWLPTSSSASHPSSAACRCYRRRRLAASARGGVPCVPSARGRPSVARAAPRGSPRRK